MQYLKELRNYILCIIRVLSSTGACKSAFATYPGYQRRQRRSDVFAVNFEHVSHFSSVSVVDFEC